MKIARVIVDVPAFQTDRPFDYEIPEKFEHMIEKGMRVIVPFGPRKVMGFVLEVADQTDLKHLKPIDDVMDLTPVLTGELIELGKWIREQTLSFHITAYQVMLPQALKAKYDKELECLALEEELSDELKPLFAGRSVIPFAEIQEKQIPYRKVQEAIKDGLVEVHYIVKSKETRKKSTWVKPAKDLHQLEEALEDFSPAAKKQRAIVEFFIEHKDAIPLKQLLDTLHTTRQTVQQLMKKGLLQTFKKDEYRDPYNNREFIQTKPKELTGEQKQAIKPIEESIVNEKHDVFLLHGVTGSGKTEIYLQTIEKVLKKGKEAIVLVPEIALTPQMVQRFKSRFGADVAVMHSGLSPGEKLDEWRKIQRQEVKVVVGARSAIFAPFQNLGIIIIDEEHESSYKQEDNPKYHARDVAVFRGQYHRCPVVLGSATPALETYARAKKGVYRLLTLSRRINNQSMPEVEIVDMREELHRGNRSMFSRSLQEKIQERLSRKEQIVLFLNRRGYSTFVICRDCGHTLQCPHCDISLTYHRKQERLKCHYCSYEIPMPGRCPECYSDTIRYFGTGTQKVEEALQLTFPEARIIRMDVDTTRNKGAHERLLAEFGHRRADILLGTQMIAKGLDFEHVTLVGVLAADSMLHLPDFRSAEKTFQLLTQVSGRAGRHELPGEVLIQTYTPEHYTVELASKYDYEQFFYKEMQIRKKFQYPPYYYLALITVSHPNQIYTIEVAQRMAKMLNSRLSGQSKVLGPTPSPLLRIKDRYRYQCMVKYKVESKLQMTIKRILQVYEEDMQKNDLQIVVDFQPYHLM